MTSVASRGTEGDFPSMFRCVARCAVVDGAGTVGEGLVGLEDGGARNLWGSIFFSLVSLFLVRPRY